MRKLLPALVALLIAGPALADVKVYNSTPPGGTPGDQILNNPALCPSVQVTPGLFEGSATLTDDGAGTVTMTDLTITQAQDIDFDTTLLNGPGAFVFVISRNTSGPAPGQTGAGSTAKSTGSVDWGVIGGWDATGFGFCISSPTTVCDNNVTPHGVTTPTSVVQSSTYDMGTWSFDAEGDYEATPYIQRTSMGAMSNTIYELRGRFVGAGIPALPLVGVGAIGLGLLTFGVRSLMRRR